MIILLSKVINVSNTGINAYVFDSIEIKNIDVNLNVNKKFSLIFLKIICLKVQSTFIFLEF